MLNGQANISSKLVVPDEPVRTGGTVTATFVVENSGTSFANNVLLYVTPPDGLAFVDETEQASTADEKTWTIGSLAPNETKTQAVVLKVARDQPAGPIRLENYGLRDSSGEVAGEPITLNVERQVILNMQAEPQELPADRNTEATLTLRVGEDGAIIGNGTMVTFSAEPRQAVNLPQDQVQLQDGIATITLTGNASHIDQQVSLTADISGQQQNASATISLIPCGERLVETELDIYEAPRSATILETVSVDNGTVISLCEQQEQEQGQENWLKVRAQGAGQPVEGWIPESSLR
jgi:uncharacterized repeat protein (TIGR01451 family)